MKKVIWGILGTARIGSRKVIPAMQKSDWVDVRAIASRSESAAHRAAGELRIPRAYGSYEALLADPEIEAVYNPLPNHLHVPLTLQAADAGKHVLCEKPIALTAEEARQLRFLINAYRSAAPEGASRSRFPSTRRKASTPGSSSMTVPRWAGRTLLPKYSSRATNTSWRLKLSLARCAGTLIYLTDWRTH